MAGDQDCLLRRRLLLRGVSSRPREREALPLDSDSAPLDSDSAPFDGLRPEPASKLGSSIFLSHSLGTQGNGE